MRISPNAPRKRKIEPKRLIIAPIYLKLPL